jgi:hypothetical protein
MEINRTELSHTSFLDGTNLWLTIKISVIIFGMLALFYKDLAVIFSDVFKKSIVIYVLAIPFVFAYLVYRQRKILGVVLHIKSEDQPKRFVCLASIAGILLVLTAVLLYWHGSYASMPLEYHLIALPIFAAGLVLFLFSLQALRLLAFPIVLLFSMVPPPSDVFAVALILILIGVLAMLIRSEKRFKAEPFVKKSGRCSQYYPMMQSSWYSCVKCGKVISTPSSTSKNEKFKLIAVIVAIIMLLSVQVPFFALAQTHDVVIANSPMGQQEPTDPLPEVQGYSLQFSYRDNQIEEVSKVDLALAYVYIPQNESLQRIWVSVQVSSESYRLQRWKTDLIDIPLEQNRLPKVTQYELKDVSLYENPAINGQYFAFQYTITNQKQAVLYWYEEARFATNSTSEQKNVGISLIVYPQNWEELPAVETQLKAVAKKIVDYWQPIKLSSPISIAVIQNGAQLAGITSLLTAITSVLYFSEFKKQKKISKNAYQKLSITNKQIVDVVRETQTRTDSTLSTIVEAYRQATSEDVNSDYLLKRLEKLEKVGIIKSEIANINDEQITVWKTWA